MKRMNGWRWFLALGLLAGMITACTSGTPSPTPQPTAAPTATAQAVATEEATDEPAGEDGAADKPTPAPTPSGPVVINAPEEPGVCETPDMQVLEDDHVRGNKDATITLIEYSDFQCPYCTLAASEVHRFVEENDNVRMIFRHLPLESIHDKAFLAAEAAEAAGAQGKFWEMHDALFEHTEEWSALEAGEARKKMGEYAVALELDMERFNNDMDKHTFSDKIRANVTLAEQAGVRGTPTVYFNTVQLPFSPSFDAMTQFMPILTELEERFIAAPERPADVATTYQATLSTSKGDIVVDLLPKSAPLNVANFISLSRSDWYSNSDFFFVVDEYVAVAGADTEYPGLGYPGYYCWGETQNAFDRPGLVGMLPDGQFFITLGSGEEVNDLTGRYALIGQVSKGMDVVQQLTRRTADDTAPADVVKSVAVTEK